MVGEDGGDGARFEGGDGGDGGVSVHEEPVECVIYPTAAVVKMQEGDEEGQGGNSVMMAAVKEVGVVEENEKEEGKSPLVKKVSKVLSRVFGRGGKV